MIAHAESVKISLRHGAGGPAMRLLVSELVAEFPPSPLGGIGVTEMDDGAAIPLFGRFLVLTTDSHVVKPPFFPGGDIGRLAVCGAVNDLAMMGATEPMALTCGLILEEGFPRQSLDLVRASIAAACREAGTGIATGDTKVMGRGELDGIVLNTTGIGFTDRVVRDSGLRPGDRLITTGTVGDHGLAVMALRHQLGLEGDLRSDVAPLNGLIRAALAAHGAEISAMKDPTRGGLASALHEMAEKSGVGIVLDEPAVPIRPEVRAAGELLGIDPLQVANEGKALLGVRPAAAESLLAVLRTHPLGGNAAIIGRATAERVGSVILDTGFGRRLLTELEGDPLPRIC